MEIVWYKPDSPLASGTSDVIRRSRSLLSRTRPRRVPTSVGVPESNRHGCDWRLTAVSHKMR